MPTSSSPTSMHFDRRRDPRFATRAPVRLCLREPGARPFSGQARDVSLGGLFVETRDPVPLYAQLDIWIHPPGQPAFRARVMAVRAAAGGVGLCFVQLTAQAWMHFDRWLGRSGGLPPVSGEIDTLALAG